ncbi:hypothetical protein [Sciscionella sediminilitoris]|uniref:hypothetical protein n=1 Tax=Sciscionella sediminilitoris TaxID=1445613 RepID=UPI0012E2D24C|nr:hypothetical protein [Sciscionella sp. SE31]
MNDVLNPGEDTVRCQYCGRPRLGSPSTDFCSQDCQQRWHAERTTPLRTGPDACRVPDDVGESREDEMTRNWQPLPDMVGWSVQALESQPGARELKDRGPQWEYRILDSLGRVHVVPVRIFRELMETLNGACHDTATHEINARMLRAKRELDRRQHQGRPHSGHHQDSQRQPEMETRRPLRTQDARRRYPLRPW